jgi:hexosaminidase
MHVYLDLMQGDSAIEAPVYATVRLKDSYAFEPVPEGVDPKYIKGGQANIWTEKIYNPRHLQYMLWPRGFAVSETLWSPREKKNWDDFIRRVETHFERFDQARIKYATAMYEPIVTVQRNAKQQLVATLNTEVNDITLHYSFDSSYPDEFYPSYTDPLTLPKDISFLRVVGYKHGRQVGRIMSIPVSSLIQRADAK